MVKNNRQGLWDLFVGFVLSGIGASLYVYCDLGSDAFNVLIQGIARVLEIRVGSAVYLTQGALLVLVIAVRRHYLGIGSLLGIFLVGSIMNLFAVLLAPLLQAAGFLPRLCCLAAAPVVVGFGIAFVKRSGLGLTPYDIVPLILHEWGSRLSFSTIRILIDAVSFLTGVILGGTVGIGTLLSVLLTGPSIQLAGSILNGRCKEQT